MRELKFRQAVFKDGEFHHWHYWGFCGYRDSFISPLRISPMGDSIKPTGYEVTESQHYTGLRCGPVSVGKEIYEGDIVRHIVNNNPSKIHFKVCWVEDGYFLCWSDDMLSSRLSQVLAEFSEVIGNIYENPELLEEG